MKYFIPINKKSIKLNPEYVPAGVRQLIPSHTEIIVSGKHKIHSAFEDNPHFVLTEWGHSIETGYVWEGRFCGELNFDLNDAFMKEAEEVCLGIQIERTMLDVTSFASMSKYLYTYRSIKVTCEHCGAQFSSKKLEDDYDDGIATETKCPVCGTWDCCEVEYETIENALKSIKNAKNQRNKTS